MEMSLLPPCRFTQGAFNYLKKISFLFFVRCSPVHMYVICHMHVPYVIRRMYVPYIIRLCTYCTMYIVFKYAVHCTLHNVHHTLYASTYVVLEFGLYHTL
jgi:hypothetical protein